VSEKQDRHGVRTATDLERKYNFGKTFAELIGLITDARESVDAASSTLRGEMENQATSLRRDSERIVAEAVKEYVKETDLEKVISNTEAKFEVTAEGIVAEAVKEYAKTSELGEVRDFAETKINATAKQISANLTRIKELSGDVNDARDFAETKINATAGEISAEIIKTTTGQINDAKSEFTATANNLTASFETAKQQIGDVDGRLQGVVEKLEKHFEFNVDGLTIKAGPGTMSLQLDNDIIRFYKNGQEFGWWDGVDFHTGNIYIAAEERAQFGNFAFTPRSNGSMDFGKVGG
jgi:hypothetical protein